MLTPTFEVEIGWQAAKGALEWHIENREPERLGLDEAEFLERMAARIREKKAPKPTKWVLTYKGESLGEHEETCAIVRYIGVPILNKPWWPPIDLKELPACTCDPTVCLQCGKPMRLVTITTSGGRVKGKFYECRACISSL